MLEALQGILQDICDAFLQYAHYALITHPMPARRTLWYLPLNCAACLHLLYILQVLKCPYKSKPEENKEKEHLHYSNTVDSWAVGVLVYELLVGCPPFYDKSKSNTEARIVSGMPHFPPTISEAAKDFICAGVCVCVCAGVLLRV